MKEIRRILLKIQKRAKGDPVKKKKKVEKNAGDGKIISYLQLH